MVFSVVLQSHGASGLGVIPKQRLIEVHRQMELVQADILVFSVNRGILLLVNINGRKAAWALNNAPTATEYGIAGPFPSALSMTGGRGSRLFQFQELPFSLHAPGIAGQAPMGPHHPVAGDQ